MLTLSLSTSWKNSDKGSLVNNPLFSLGVFMKKPGLHIGKLLFFWPFCITAYLIYQNPSVGVLLAMALLSMFAGVVFILEESASQGINSTAQCKMSSILKMAGGISHEINNPLTIIKMANANLQRMNNTREYDMEIYAKLLDKIDTSAQRMAGTINNLNRFCGKGSNSYQEINLPELVKNTGLLMQSSCDDHSIILSVDPSEDCKISCCPIDVSSTLLALLNNAVEYLRDQDAVRYIDIRIEPDPAEKIVDVRVINTGAKMTKKDAELAFRPFYSTKNITNHPGMGLNIAMGIMVNMGGSIAVDHHYPNTCFVLRFPLLCNAQKGSYCEFEVAA